MLHRVRDDFSFIHHRTSTDPLLFVKSILGNAPWGKQAEVISALRVHDRVTVRSCHASGKTWSAANCALWFLYDFSPSIVLTTAPTFRQVKKVLWKEIRRLGKSSRFPLGGEFLDTEIKLEDDWFAFGLATDDPERFQGFHSPNILVIVDEAAGVSEKIYQAIEGALATENAKLLLIGHPTASFGTFYESFKNPNFYKVKISAFDTPNFTQFGITLKDLENEAFEEKITAPLPYPFLVTPNWAFQRLSDWGKDSPMFQAKVLAEFPTSLEDQLIPLSWVENAIERFKSLAGLESEDLELGVDVARFGASRTAIAKRYGYVIPEIATFQGRDIMETCGRVASILSQNPKAKAKIDDIGVGGGVVDRLHELGFRDRVFGINVSAKGSDDRFVNLRSELWWNIRELLEENLLFLPEDSALVSQLTSIRHGYTSAGKIKVESKEEMEKRGLKSPDEADALCLSFARPRQERTPTIRIL